MAKTNVNEQLSLATPLFTEGDRRARWTEPSKFVFHRHGRPFKRLIKGWRAACAKAGVGFIPHDLRRTAVRNLERAGVPRSTAMAMVGHKTESVYRRYAIVDEVMLREGAVKLATHAANLLAQAATKSATTADPDDEAAA